MCICANLCVCAFSAISHHCGNRLGAQICVCLCVCEIESVNECVSVCVCECVVCVCLYVCVCVCVHGCGCVCICAYVQRSIPSLWQQARHAHMCVCVCERVCVCVCMYVCTYMRESTRDMTCFSNAPRHIATCCNVQRAAIPSFGVRTHISPTCDITP